MKYLIGALLGALIVQVWIVFPIGANKVPENPPGPYRGDPRDR